jgi:hypothetical protein
VIQNTLCVCAVSAALACGLADRSEHADPGGEAGEDDGAGETENGGPGDDEPGGEDSLLDVGMPDFPGDPSEDEPCKKVDLLFVIDNSGSMGPHQANLIANFPGFVDGMKTELAEAEDYHIGIVTSDAYFENGDGCTDIGHLVTQTGGPGSSDSVCAPYSTGKRYMDDTEPDLYDKFACAAHVGTRGSSHEAPVEAAYQGISPGLNAAGACNEGFVRDDALLVIVIVTDEDDEMATEDCPWCGSEGTPPEWFDTIVGHKGGIEENVVVIAIVGQGWQQDCTNVLAVNIIEMTEMFTYGIVGDVCNPSYADFFAETLATIDLACEGFTPPG